jgi:hypothetical protein
LGNVRFDVPRLADELPCCSVKATVEVTLKGGSKREYTKQIEIDLRDGGPKPEKNK